MSGGVAYVYDEDGTFRQRCNTSMVDIRAAAHAPKRNSSSCAAARDDGHLHRGQTDEEQLES